jgi:hypothetical protein
LVKCLTMNQQFRFGPDYGVLELPHSPYIPITPIMDALHGDTPVKYITIPQRIWNPKELKQFLICLSTLNTSITNISLVSHNFEPNSVETISKILKLNPRIKTLQLLNGAMTNVSTEGINKFCDSMEYYTFETLVLSNSGLTNHYNTIFESLKYNQSVKSLTMSGEYLQGGPCKTLCRSLVSNPTITDLQILFGGGLDAESFEAFKEVISANYIKKLTLQNSTIDKESLKRISKELKANTSITELNFISVNTSFNLMSQIIAANKGITKLDLSGNSFQPKELKCLHLNTTLKELIMTNCWGMTNYSPLFLQLVDNKNIKRLVVGNNSGELDDKSLEELLTNNKSLTDFTIHSEYYNGPKENIITAIANSLTVNKTLRKLSLTIIGTKYETFAYLFNALKVNNTLLELHTKNIRDISLTAKPPNGNEVDDFVLDLLKTNKTLRFITGAANYAYLEEKLKANRDTQDKVIHDTCTLIKMIVTKPSSFVLPIELWAMVFKYVSYEFTPLDFEQFFQSFIK